MSDLLAILRRPGDPAGHELGFLGREPVDAERLAAQHAAYVQALLDLGLALRVLDPLPGHPDALYVEDCAVVLDEVAVLTRPGSEARRAEVAALAPVLAEFRECLRIDVPGTVDGGDVLVCDRVLVVGWGKRTNHAGLKQLAHLLLDYGDTGYTVKAAEVGGCLHLKSAVTRLDEGRLLANPRLADLGRVPGMELVEVDPCEPYGANVLAVGGVLLCSAAYPRTNERLAGMGFEIVELELDELHKMEAAVTCPSILLRTSVPR